MLPVTLNTLYKFISMLENTSLLTDDVTFLIVCCQVEKKLAARLQAGIQAWTAALEGTKEEVDFSMDTNEPAQPTHKPGGDPTVQYFFFYPEYFFFLLCF
jgi:hypothetical protein